MAHSSRPSPVSFVLAALALTGLVSCTPTPETRTRATPAIVPAATLQAEPTPEPALVTAPRASTRGTWQRPGAFWRWTWPEASEFQTVWEGWGAQTRPWRVLIGSLQVDAEAAMTEQVLLLDDGPEGLRLRRHWTSAKVPEGALDGALFEVVWAGEAGELTADESVTLTAADGSSPRRLTITPTYVEEPGSWHADAFDDWVYVTTLLTFEPEVRRPYRASWDQDAESEARDAAVWRRALESLKGPLAERREALDALFASDDVTSDDGAWEDVLAHARAAGDQETMLQVYERWQPVGRCSRDDRPRRVARDYAAVCERVGRLGCYVQLGVQLLADSFNRRVYSSWAERANATGIEALADTGLDTGRLLRGLSTTYASSLRWPVGSGPSRVARAALELEDGGELFEELEARVQDPRLDDLNRLKAAVTLGLIIQREEATNHYPGASLMHLVVDHMRDLDVPPIARRWLAQMATE